MVAIKNIYSQSKTFTWKTNQLKVYHFTVNEFLYTYEYKLCQMKAYFISLLTGGVMWHDKALLCSYSIGFYDVFQL